VIAKALAVAPLGAIAVRLPRLGEFAAGAGIMSTMTLVVHGNIALGFLAASVEFAIRLDAIHLHDAAFSDRFEIGGPNCPHRVSGFEGSLKITFGALAQPIEAIDSDSVIVSHCFISERRGNSILDSHGRANR
jgi:hypothetical protein